jgi:signal transduction histidine kinase
MSTPAASAAALPAPLRAFPGAVLELSPDGAVLASNGRLERRLERQVAGRFLADALDEASRAKLAALLEPADEAAPAALWELVLEGRDTLTTLGFYAVREPGTDDRLWLVECPRDPRFDRLYEEFATLMSEQATMQRQLAKEKARLGRALEEVEREFQQNERLSRTLQAQNEEMEAQNEELLSLTEELHAGQEQLLSVNHQMERRSRELQLALSARNRFYAAMSHELRTPINAVMGYNDLLLAGVYGGLNEQQELAVERSQRAARHLRELVNDVLDISKLEAGKVELELEEVRLGDLVEDLFATLRPIAEARGVELKLMQRDVPRSLVTDPRRVRQVLLNLLSNAIKFGRGRPVWVNLTRASDGGVDVEVVDSGDGIRPEDAHRIFDEFVQLERGENHEGHAHEGTGLGLPIARRLARLVGGSLDLSSTPGVGSTFRLWLPATPPSAVSPAGG